MLDCRQMASCVVHYVGLDGLRHSGELQAESLYEAAVKAIVIFRQHGCEPGTLGKLEGVRTSVVHTLTRQQVQEWLVRGAKTPKEAVTKQQLRALL
jgi:hypothetical protein